MERRSDYILPGSVPSSGRFAGGNRAAPPIRRLAAVQEAAQHVRDYPNTAAPLAEELR